MTTPSTRLHDYLPARFSTAAARHWVPSSTTGKSSSPLRFFADDRGFVELLRMEPGTVMPLHRHTGEIHAYNLSGMRKLCTGALLGPGERKRVGSGMSVAVRVACGVSRIITKK